MGTLGQDFRFAIRSLLKNRKFATTALLTIVLTVGGITTVFTLVSSVLLRPLPFPDPERLVTIMTSRDVAGIESRGASDADYSAWKERSRSFENLTLYRRAVSTLNPDTAPERVFVWRTTHDLFPLIEAQPVLGRPILPDDHAPAAPLVALISYEFWQSHFGGRSDVIGETLSLRGDTPMIIGVMPASFRMPTQVARPPIGGTELWQPLRLDDRRQRGFRGYTVLGRLRPNVGIEAARSEMAAISAHLAEEYPDTNTKRIAEVTPLLEEVVGDTARILWIFFGAVSCVLLIGLANLINLQVVRNAARESELFVRAALGAGRVRLIRQLLTESVLLSLVGGIVGLAVASQAIRVLLATIPVNLPREDQVSAGLDVVLFALLVSALVGIVFGLVPCLRALRTELGTMNDESRLATMSGNRSRIQRVLIAVETATAVTLLVGAGLLANSFWRLMTVESGMDEEPVLTVTGSLPLEYRGSNRVVPLWDSALEATRALVDVEAAAVLFNSSPPLSGMDMIHGGIFPEGREGNRRDGFFLSRRQVGSDYFRTMGVPIVAGRSIVDTDTDDVEEVVVINESAARALWPGENAVGKRLSTSDTRFLRVVGVVRDFVHRRVDDEVRLQMYTSPRQASALGNTATLMVRVGPGATGVGPAVASIIRNLEPEADIEVRSMADVRWQSLREERFRTAVLSVFAAGAVFLALVGIWGVVSYSVVQRRREIGLRMALGATAGGVTGLMVRQALGPALVGLAFGLVASFGLERFLGSYLFGIQTTDPATLGAAAGLLAIVAFAASLVPARRAAHVDPMVALRYE